MRIAFYFTKVLIVSALSLLALGLSSCEDDPILEIQTSQSAGGSYGKMVLRDSTEVGNIMKNNNPEEF